MPLYTARISTPGDCFDAAPTDGYNAGKARERMAKIYGVDESQIYDTREVKSNDGGGSDSGEVSDSTIFWGGAVIALIAFGAATAFLGPFFSGPAFAFGAYKGLEKVTGKDKSDYEAVATGQSKSVGSILCLALIIAAGIGGVRFGVNYQSDVREIDANKTEQVSQ